MSNAFSLEGKVALVTGGGRGIGAGIARRFAEAGAAVAVTARTRAEIDATADEIRAAGGRALAIQADLTKLDLLPGVVDQTVAEFGGLDIVVNNAGGALSPAFVDTRPTHLNTEFQMIVASPFELCRLALPHLLARPGASIINILSPGVYKAPRGNLAYYTVKAAMGQMTKLMAADLGPRVRVNGIVPGPIETPALKNIFDKADPAFRTMVEGSTRVRRMGSPDDVAYAAVYLASPAAAFVTGALLPVNGGDVDEIRSISPDL
jgi:7-alpha-hydroxysteroid dehydrogenase